MHPERFYEINPPVPEAFIADLILKRDGAGDNDPHWKNGFRKNGRGGKKVPKSVLEERRRQQERARERTNGNGKKH